MSRFTKTAAEVDALSTALTAYVTTVPTAPVPDRKEALTALQASLAKLTPAVDKFVAKADAGEADPNKRLYGAGMVTKIRALAGKLNELAAQVEKEDEDFKPVWAAFEQEIAAEEAERKRQEEAEEERKRAEQQEKERQEREAEAERLRKEEEERKAKEEAERMAAEKKRLAAEKAAREEEERKKKEEEAKAEVEAKALMEKEAAEKAKREADEKAKADAARGINLSIKTAKSKTLSLAGVPPECDVAELKKRIADEHSIPAQAQRLIFRGRLLTDGKTIDTYKIVDGCAVHLVENTRAANAAKSAVQAATKPIVPPGTVCQLKDGKPEFKSIQQNCGRSRLIVVDWSAPWCGPCRMIAPVFARLAVRFPDVTFVKVDTELSTANSELASEKGISSYPTFHYYIGASNIHSFSGASGTQIENGIRQCRTMLASTAKDQTSDVASGSASGSASGQDLTRRVLTALTTLKNNCSTTDFIVAVRTLLTFVRNVVDHPGEEKYRKVRTGNNTFQTRLASKTGGVDCMYAFGFEAKQESGENYLSLSAEAASNPQLPTVRRQLEQALQAVGGSESASRQANTNRAAPAGDVGGMGGLGGMPPMGGMGGMGGMGTPADAALMQEVMADPNFQQLAQELVNDQSLLPLLMQAQTAMQTGDHATLQNLMANPSLARLTQAMRNSPAIATAMQRRMMAGGLPGMPGAGGMPGMGMPGMPGGQNPTGGATGGANPAQNAQGQQNPTANAQPQYPGAPTTAEEEDRLLQEAIRLSMQDSATSNNPSQEPKTDDDAGNES